MKNFFKLFGIIAVAVIVSLTGCSTATKAQITGVNQGAFSVVSIAAKDFTTLGLVFTENRLEHQRSGEKASASGEILTYNALLREAQRLGGDAIINVVIDTKIVSQAQTTSVSNTESRVETWYGSALAIKYTNKLVEKDIISNATFQASGSSGGSGDIGAPPKKKKLFGIIPLP